MSIHLANQSLDFKNWPNIQRQAKKGHVESMYLYGIAHILGGYVEQNKNTAYLWLKKAALKGHADANFRCGFLMQQGITDSEYTALDWFKKSASLGSDAGRCAIGNEWTYKKIQSLRWWNKWVERSDMSDEAKSAYAAYKEAADNQYTLAYYFLGLHALKGWGVKKDIDAARTFFELGIKDQDRDCAYTLAQTYLKTDPKHRYYLEKAADLGHPESQYKLAKDLLSVRDSETDKQAMTWLKRAAMQGHAFSILLILHNHQHGVGVIKDNFHTYTWAYRAYKQHLISEKKLQYHFDLLSDAEKEHAQERAELDSQNYQRLSDKLFSQPGTSW